MSKKNVILGLVAVTAIAGVALLMTTEKGKKLRKKMSKKGMDTLEHYKSKLDHYKNKVNKYAESKV
ncbi:MAG: YtxH domain-containing protein [Ferruginibacter sp.]